MKKITCLIVLFVVMLHAQLPLLLDSAFLQIKMDSKQITKEMDPLLSLEMIQKEMNGELDFYAEFDSYNVDPFEFFMPGIFGQHEIGISKSKASYFAMCKGEELSIISVLALDDSKTFQKSINGQQLAQWKKIKNVYFHERGRKMFFYDKNFAYLIERNIERSTIKEALRNRLDKQYGQDKYSTPMLTEWSWEDYEYNEVPATEEGIEEVTIDAESIVEEVEDYMGSSEENTKTSNIVELSYDQEDSIVALIRIELQEAWIQNYLKNGKSTYWSSHIVKANKPLTLFTDYSKLNESTNVSRFLSPIEKQLNSLSHETVGDFLLEAYTMNNEFIFELNYITKDAKALAQIFNSNFKTKVNKYLPNEPAYISGGIAMDSKKYYDFVMQIIQNLPGNEQSLASKIKSGYALFDLAFDQEAMSQFIPGENYFYSCGSIEDSITRVTYDYDENFEYHRVEKRTAISLPKMYYFVATQNEEAMKHLLNIAHIDPYFSKDEHGIYTLNGNGESPKFYFRVYDELLMISNDYDFILQPKLAVNNEVKANLFVWDVNGSIEAGKNMFKDNLNEKDEKSFNTIQTYFDRIELDAWNLNENGLKSTLKIKSSQTNEAFFMTIAKLIESLNK